MGFVMNTKAKMMRLQGDLKSQPNSSKEEIDSLKNVYPIKCKHLIEKYFSFIISYWSKHFQK